MSDLIIMTLTEKKLQESEEKYRNLFEKSSNAIVLLDITGKIIECNSATESVFGYSVEELIGKNYLELPYYSKRMLNTLIKRSQAISKKLDLEPQELEVKKKDGNIATIRTIISYIKLGNQDFFQVIIQDITEQKNAEQKLKESETKFRSILEAIPDIYFLLSKDSTVLEYRGKREDLYLEPEEFMGKKLIDILPSDLGKKTLEFVKKTITTKQPHSFEYELPIKNEIHYYEARYFYLSEERISCFVRDITERKKAEKEIYNLAKFPSEDPNPIMRVNNEKLLYINQSGKNLFNIIEGGKIPKQFKKILKQVLMENIIKKLEIEIMGKNYSFALIPIKQENYVNIYGQEITKRKKFENELLIEKKFSDDLINTSIDTIFVFNPQTGKAIRWNKAFNEISGYTDEEISSMKAPDSYYRKEDLIRAAQATKEVTKEGSTKVEMSLITKGGEKIPFEYSGTLMQDTEGNTLIMSIGRDITERKKFEMELKESEEKFRTIAEHSLVGISIIQDGIIKYFNKTLTEIDGYTEEDVKSWKPNEFQKVFHPEDREFVMEQARKKQRGDPDVIPQYQYRITRKDGKIRWIEIFSKTVTYKGRPADLAMTHDITDKVNAERLIKDSEAKFSKAFNSNALAMCISTLKEGRIIEANKSFLEMLDITITDYIGKPILELGGWNFDSKVREETLKLLMKQGLILNAESQFTSPTGEPKFGLFSFVKIELNGEPHILTIINDITQRRLAEIKLKESEEKFSKAFNSNALAMCITTFKEGIVIEANKAFLEILDITTNDYIGKPILELGGWNFDSKVREETLKLLMKQGLILNAESQFTSPTGEPKFGLFSFVKIELNGEPHILTIINDITQRRLAEIKLKESEEKFSKAFNSNALAMCITTFEESLLIEANKAFLDVIDISREEYIGKRTTAFNSWSPVPKRRDLMLKQLKDEGIIVNVESEFVSFTGETKYGLFSFVKIELNEKSHILTIINDITPLKLAEQKLKESEVKFSKAFNSNALAMSITTFEEGIVIEANKAFLEILDFTTDDYIGKSIEELQGWSLQPKRRGLMLKQLKEEGIIVNAESEFVSFKGEPKYGLFSFVKIELNEEPHILTIINDITPLKLAEQKLKQSEKHYRLISEASRAVMWTSDLNINLTYVDPIVLNIFGATSEEVIALPLSSYLTPESLETTYRVMEEELRIEMSKTKDLNRSWTYETIQIHKNGTKIPVENILTFLRDDDEKAIGILGISRDISERKKTENQLKESEKKYREAYDMANFYKDLFTHDMNNILHIIGSSVEIIDLQLGESEKSVFIENMTKMIHSQVDRGAKLISDVRTLTELDDAEIPINRVNITEFLKKSINFIEKSYSEKNLSIFAKKLDRDYYTNGNDLLQDVFDNILRNGIKHNENSDIQISIKIFKQKIKGKKYIKLEFIDNGIGIPEDRKIDIFQPSNRERKGSKGMGIGLSLVKKILTIFKGKIWVEDKIEGDYTQGSKFIVLLPEVD